MSMDEDGAGNSASTDRARERYLIEKIIGAARVVVKHPRVHTIEGLERALKEHDEFTGIKPGGS